jgi:hypothetical protein
MTTATLLNKTELEAYHRDGYLILDRPIFAQDKFDRLKQACCELFCNVQR